MATNMRSCVPEDLDWISPLVGNYPYKEYQRQFYGVDRERVSSYNVSRVERTVRNSNPGAISVFTPNGDPLGFFILSGSKWHSDLFGLQYFKMGGLWVVNEDAKMPVMEAVAQRAKQVGADLVDFRTDADDFGLAQAAERVGARFIGMSIKYAIHSKYLDKNRENSYRCDSQNNVAIRRALKDDWSWMAGVASEAHQVSYFFNDSSLSTEKTHKLFSAWVERCLNGVADEVLVLEAGGQPAGLVTLLLPKDLTEAFGKRFGVLDFIALAPEFQGKGLGKRFALEAFRWLAERADLLEARTMVNNYPAQNLYSKLGFRVIASDNHFHLGER